MPHLGFNGCHCLAPTCPFFFSFSVCLFFITSRVYEGNLHNEACLRAGARWCRYPPLQPALLSLSSTPLHTVWAPATHGDSFPEAILCSLFLDFFPGFVASLLPSFCLCISFHLLFSPMFLPLKPPSAHKNGPLWNPSSVEKAWVAAMMKGNEIYKQISHEDFG